MHEYTQTDAHRAVIAIHYNLHKGENPCHRNNIQLFSCTAGGRGGELFAFVEAETEWLM